MEFDPTYELNLMSDNEGQFDEIMDIIREYGLKKDVKTEDPVFKKINLCKRLPDQTFDARMIIGRWKYSEIYDQAVNLLGSDNVKIGMDNVPYEQAFADETKNREQYEEMRKKQVCRAMKCATRSEWNSDLYQYLRRNHSREQARDLIYEGKLDQISMDLQAINKTLAKVIHKMESSDVSELQKDLLEEQKEQM